MNPVIQYVTLPEAEYKNLIRTQEEILAALQKLTPTSEYLTIKEFCSEIKASRWTIDTLKAAGRLPTKKIGRKHFVHRQYVTKFFEGQL